jgi:hypothetical protein
MEAGRGGTESDRWTVFRKDSLDRESKAYKYIEGLLLLVGIIVGFGLFLFGLIYSIEMMEGGFSVAGLIGFAKLFVVLILGFIVWHVGNRARDSVDAWDQSLLRRRIEQELRETFRRGGRIIYDNVECEVWHDQFVPKQGGKHES